MRNPIHRIAIVGGGPSGVSILCELLQALRAKGRNRLISITLIEKSGEFGSGLPYRTKLDAHIINMTVATMSLKSDHVDHFYKWLLANPDKWNREYNITSLKEDDVVPRRLFGLYVNHMYKDAREMADTLGIDVVTIKGEATDLCETGDGVRLCIERKEKYFDQAFICVGNQSATVGQELEGVKGYFHDVWSEERIMENIPYDEPVAILGSGLTAIDAMITLQENGHRAPITMLSRHGMLPKVRNKAKPYELVYISPRNIQRETNNGKHRLSLNDTIRLLKAEFENANIEFGADRDYYRAADSSPAEILKQDIARVKNGHANYFSVLKAIDKQIGEFWNAMSLEARTEFDQYYNTLWNIHCYPMPLMNGARTLRSIENGQLSVRGGFREISYDPASETFQLRMQIGQSEEVLETRYVINATGQGTDILRSRNELLQSGIRSGALVPHAFGGIDVDFETCRAKSDLRRYSEKVYVVGLLTRGVHFYTNSVVENVRCAKRAAIDAVERLSVDAPLTVPAAITLSELVNATSGSHQADF